MNNIINPVRHGLIMAITALILGALWAAYMATNHEQLHNDFELEAEKVGQAQMQHLMEDVSAEPMQANHSHDTTSQTAHEHEADSHAVDGQHSHSGNLAQDAMQRLLRGHIHFIGIGVLAAVLLLIAAFTSLKPVVKKLLGWTLGLGALGYPPAWILMGFRTVELGPQAAEASVMWLFGPAVALLLGSMVGLLVTLFVEAFSLQEMPIIRYFFQVDADKA